MSISTISDFFLVSSEDGTQVSYEVFQTREAAQARLDRAPDDIYMRVGIKEVPVPARFICVVSSRDLLRDEVSNYCWFGSRVVAEGPHYVIVGATLAYWRSQADRLASGLLGSGVYDTLEEAIQEAEETVATLYGTK